MIRNSILFLMLICSSITFAHGGRTDKSGGHNDRKNGGYHYHHGFSAHQHKNGKCPYKNKASMSLIVAGIGGLSLLGFKRK